MYVHTLYNVLASYMDLQASLVIPFFPAKQNTYTPTAYTYVG